MNNNNKNKRPLTSFAKSVLTEMIRLMPVQVDIWRLEKEIRTLKSQNLELTSRLAAVESGMAPRMQDKSRIGRRCPAGFPAGLVFFVTPVHSASAMNGFSSMPSSSAARSSASFLS